MKKVLVPLAEGCEELEAITIINLLRRAEIEVITASLSNPTVKCSRGTPIVADKSLDEIYEDEIDMVVLPGGLPGADYLNSDQRIHKLLKKHNLSMDNIDLWELNEAFAVQVIYCRDELGIPNEILNVKIQFFIYHHIQVLLVRIS